jgi:hypothetical protein
VCVRATALIWRGTYPRLRRRLSGWSEACLRLGVSPGACITALRELLVPVLPQRPKRLPPGLRREYLLAFHCPMGTENQRRCSTNHLYPNTLSGTLHLVVNKATFFFSSLLNNQSSQWSHCPVAQLMPITMMAALLLNFPKGGLQYGEEKRGCWKSEGPVYISVSIYR